MKMIKLFSIILVLLISNSILYSSNTDLQERTKSFSVNKGGTLDVNVSPGDITINTWNKNEVFVKITGADEDDLQEIEMIQTGNNISIKFESDWGWSDEIDFYITVPSEFNLDLNSAGGNITVADNLNGYLEAATQGGNVNFKNVSGRAKVHTSGGNINAGDVDGLVKFKTMGGNINTGRVKGEYTFVNTMGGNINIISSSSDLDAKTYGGNINIGDIGGAAKVITYGGNINLKNVSGNAFMETYGGNLSLESASGEVEAGTYGGNISLKDVTGSIDASTAGGNIYAELSPSGSGQSVLKTSAGDIELRIPANAKATIDAKIDIQGWTEEEFEIESDFSSSTYDVGDDEITATYELNGGGTLIKLRTVNSDIKIKKL